MQAKQIDIEGIGKVNIQRNKKMRSIRLRVDHRGNVILSMPGRLAQIAAINFAKSKASWIKQERLKKSINVKDTSKLYDGTNICIKTSSSNKPSSKNQVNNLIISIPPKYSENERQKYIEKKINDLLRNKAESYLLPRLNYLAKSNDIKYNSASVAMLRSRWGSCDHKKHIKLSAYLVQLPSKLIDYVLLHELNHINHMNHSKKFWTNLENMYADISKARKEIKKYSPNIHT